MEQQAAQPELKPEYVALLKDSILRSVMSKYAELINLLRSLPFHQAAMQYAYMNLDQGVMWVDQVIKSQQLVGVQAPPAPVAPPEAVVVPDNGAVQDHCVEAPESKL